jgi:drug/metabolite transporter (DMT)-like permease
MDFLRLPLIALVGYVFYHEPLEPAVIVGAVVVFAATWVNLRSSSGAPAVRTAPAHPASR